MASRALSRSKIGRLAARLRVTRAPAVSPRSGSSAPIAWVATRSSSPHMEGVRVDRHLPSRHRREHRRSLLLRYPCSHSRQRAPQVPRTLRRGHEPRRHAKAAIPAASSRSAIRSLGIEVSAASSPTTLPCGKTSPPRTWSGASITIWPWTAGPVRVSLPSSTRCAYPPPISRDGRGVRGRRTQGLWRSGHIRNLVVNPVYKGLLQYGRRSSRSPTAVR